MWCRKYIFEMTGNYFDLDTQDALRFCHLVEGLE